MFRNPGSVATDIYFGENSCTGHEIGNHLIFDYDIESCKVISTDITCINALHSHTMNAYIYDE